MLHESIYSRLGRIFESADYPLPITPDLSGWDSLTHIILMLTAEKEFGIKFAPSEIGKIDNVSDLVRVIKDKVRIPGKVLVLDLDNTLWGGAIGEDGLEGIEIGEAHLAVQRMALELRERGVLLAVASKNGDDMARLPFEKHPDMLLKLEHFAAFQANWNDKATSIRAIADELSIGLDSIVFLDDDPVERGLVRRLLPEVGVPNHLENVEAYFAAGVLTDEDRKRASYYQDNAKRDALKKQVGVDEYLAMLEMTITCQPFDAAGRTRIAQLVNKSNQYNLTTRRYTEAEIEAAERDPSVFTLQVRLRDIFGDNGMISVVMCRSDAPCVWEIDTWLMSCRVIGRKVEHMVLREVVKHARAAGIRQLIGIYRPTERNGIVADHYARLGFEYVGEEDSGVTHWELTV